MQPIAFRVTHQTVLVNTQAANSRLFSIRNAHAQNLLRLRRLTAQWMQTGNHTAAILDDLALYKVTGFTVSDTTNKVNLAGVNTNTNGVGPGSAEVRGLAAAGNSAGMTGGTLAKAGGPNPLSQLSQWLLAAQATAGTVFPMFGELIIPKSPLVLAPNEGIIIENSILLGAAAASAVYFELEWDELVP